MEPAERVETGERDPPHRAAVLPEGQSERLLGLEGHRVRDEAAAARECGPGGCEHAGIGHAAADEDGSGRGKARERLRRAALDDNEIRDAEKEILSLDSTSVTSSRADEELRLLAGRWNIRSALRGGIPFHSADSTLQIQGNVLERRDGAQVFC